MSRTSTSVGWLLGVSILLTSAGSAQGGGRGGWDRTRADGDIESLQARVRHEGGNWRLDVRYEVEIEDACPADRFDLVLTLVNGQCPVLDGRGRPVTMVVPLGRPACARGDEWKFASAVSTCVPCGAIADPRRLSVRGQLVRACQGGGSLDREESCVRFDSCERGCGSCDRVLGREVKCGPIGFSPAPRIGSFERRERIEVRWGSRR